VADEWNQQRNVVVQTKHNLVDKNGMQQTSKTPTDIVRQKWANGRNKNPTKRRWQHLTYRQGCMFAGWRLSPGTNKHDHDLD